MTTLTLTEGEKTIIISDIEGLAIYEMFVELVIPILLAAGFSSSSIDESICIIADEINS